MCSLFRLHEGYTLPYNLLHNAVHNNEHGYGILIKANKKIQVIKDMPEKVDPEKIYKILKDNEDVERWVHLRNMSSGELHMDNVQPIQVYHSSKRDVFFMHNGTIYNIHVSDNQKAHIGQIVDDKKDSDSRKFAITKIAPLLIRFKGENGPADIQDPFIQEILLKTWQVGSGRGVLVSSDQDPLLFNSTGWEKIKDKNGEEFLASNNDYFNEVKRGTMFEAAKAKAEAERVKNLPAMAKEARKNMPSSDTELHILEYPPFERTISLSEDLVNILEEYDLYAPEGFIALGNVERSELIKLFQKKLGDAVSMFLFLTSYLKDATLKNETMAEEIENLKKTIIQIHQDKKREVISLRQDKKIPIEREVHVG